MPSLFRFLLVIAVVGGLGYGIVLVLANFVHPTPREISVSVPPTKFYRQR